MKKTVNTKESKSTLTTTNTNKKGAIIMKKTNIRSSLLVLLNKKSLKSLQMLPIVR